VSYRVEWDSVSGGWETAAEYRWFWRARKHIGKVVVDGLYARRWRVVEAATGRILLSVERHAYTNLPAHRS